jgi:Fe-Mn family superoxide dismutase
MNSVIPLHPVTASTFNLDRVTGLSKKAIELHLGLYQTYVKELNSILDQLHEFPRDRTLAAHERLQRDGLVRRLAFEHCGVSLHELFFEQLTGPGSAPAAATQFSEAVQTSFGGFEQWKKDVIELGQTRGVGWVITYRSDAENSLINVWVDDHTRGHLPGMTPLAVFDLWEHAFMLDFKPSQRTDYLKILFDNIDWNVIEQRCA